MAQVAETFLDRGASAQLATELASQITAKSADKKKLMGSGLSHPATNELAIQIAAGASAPTGATERLMRMGFPGSLAKAITTAIAAENA